MQTVARDEQNDPEILYLPSQITSVAMMLSLALLKILGYSWSSLVVFTGRAEVGCCGQLKDRT